MLEVIGVLNPYDRPPTLLCLPIMIGPRGVHAIGINTVQELWKGISTASNSSNGKRMVERGFPTCTAASCLLPN